MQAPPEPLPCRCRGQLGALRLAVRLVEDRVLPPHYYQPLIQLLTEPILCPGQVGAVGTLRGGRGPPRCGDLSVPTLPSPQPPAGTALAILEEVTSGESRQDVATKLVKIFLGQGLAVPLLDYLTTRELARTSKCQGQGHHLHPPPQTLMGRRVGPPRGRRVSLGLGTPGTAGASPHAHLTTASALFQRTPTPSSVPTRWPPSLWSSS